MKLPARAAPFLFGALLSMIMVALLSGLLLLRREGLHPGFVALWAESFLATWPVAFPTVLVVAPVVRRLVGAITQAPLPQGAGRG